MKMYHQREQEAVKEEQGQEEIPQIEDSESEEETTRKKIGDKLFEEDEGPINLREMAKDMDPQLFRMVVEKEAPELIAMLNELQESLTLIREQLQPVLTKLKTPSSRLSKLLISSKQGRTYLEMKLNLTLSYCTFLTFYLLLKVEGAANSVSHPVTYKLTHIKTLMEKLKPMDEKMEKQVKLVLNMDLFDDKSEELEDEEMIPDEESE